VVIIGTELFKVVNRHSLPVSFTSRTFLGFEPIRASGFTSKLAQAMNLSMLKSSSASGLSSP
jgi:hypothetical protein